MKQTSERCWDHLSADHVVALVSCRSLEEFAAVLCMLLCDCHVEWCIVARGGGGTYHSIAHAGLEVVPARLTSTSDVLRPIAELPTQCDLHRIGLSEGEEIVTIVRSRQEGIEPIIAVARAALDTVAQRRKTATLERSLLERNQLLQTMFELTRDATVTTSRERLLHIAGLRLLAHTLTTRLMLVAIDRHGNCTTWTRGIRLDCRTIIELTSSISTPCSLDECSSALRCLLADQYIEYVLPLRVREEPVGIILLGARADGSQLKFDDAFLVAYANALAVALEQLELVERLVEQQRLEQELLLARSIQQRLLPTSDHLQTIHSAMIAAYLEPARHVSGDYFDVVEHAGKVVCIIADVCGKGIAASLMMAHLHAAFHLLVRTGATPSGIMTELNRLLVEHTDIGSFVTAIIVQYDPVTRTLSYCNAGHPRPILVSASGDCATLGEGSLVLGVLDTAVYTEHTLDILPSQTLCLYSDGITEAVNNCGEEFGTERLSDVLARTADQQPHSMLEAVCQAIAHHVGSTTLNDDRTIVFFRPRTL